jgi:hypothetical protein
MNISFDDKLNEIPHFRIHPSYLPFVGEHYEDYRVLHIGESHFVDQAPGATKYGISYFEKWWADPCREIDELCPEWIDIRCVIAEYMKFGSKKGIIKTA